MQVVVVGGGTVGLASAWSLAKRGYSVRVIEPHEVPHEHGSHTGYTRVIRQAYHEGAHYVPWAKKADRMWVELEEGRAGSLLCRTGLFEFGAADDPDFVAAMDACTEHGIEHHRFDATEASSRYPFVLPEGWQGCFTPSGAYLRVGPCLQALARQCRALGVEFVRDAVQHIEYSSRPKLRLQSHADVAADRVVVAAGARSAQLLPLLRQKALRRVLFWLRASDETAARSWPTWAGFAPDGFFYGFPYNEEGFAGLKVACHVSSLVDGLEDEVEPDVLDRELHEADWAPVQAFLRRHAPHLGEDIVAHKVCLYSSTPDGHFIIDRHPDSDRVVMAAGMSGHGFKFAPALGDVVAELLEGGARIPAFSWDRPALKV